jgi:beta-aspartyl-peptidase (threonine type)
MVKQHNRFTIIVHGGAWDIPLEVHQDHLTGVENAAQIGYERLKQGESARAAVIAAVKQMEDDPAFDAGFGSFLNLNGEVEMDAIVMDGSDLSFGSVAAIQNVSNPVEVAELVRSDTDHALLAGQGATEFAHKKGIPLIPTEHLLIGRELERYKRLKKKKFTTREFFETQEPHDTVGAVAIDRSGNIAVATSTGGTPNKLPGRIGDSPLIGSGAYADSLIGGASSTGWGESLMKVLLAKTTVDFIARKQTAKQAAKNAIKLLHDRVDGRGGVICVDKNRRSGFFYNTPFMARAVADQDGVAHVGI